MKKYWEKFTDLFGNTIFHPQFIMLSFRNEVIQKIIKLSYGQELIDLGCGRMPYRKLIEPGLKRYIGVDHPKISELYNPESKPEILADITRKLPVKDKSFDVAIMLEVLEYLPNPGKTFKEVARILKRDGIFIITTPFLYPLHDIPFDRNRFTEIQLKEFLGNANFKIKTLRIGGSFLSFWFLSLNVYLMKTIMDLANHKKDLTTLTYLIILTIFTPFIVLTTNILFALMKDIKIASKNYFPIDYFIVAIKQ